MAITLSGVVRRGTILLAAGFAASIALTACGAGQITHTDRTKPSVPGVNVNAGDIALRDVMVQYSGPNGYRSGGSAPLVVRLFNTGGQADALVKVASPDAASVVLAAPTGTTVPADCLSATPSLPPPPAPSPSESAPESQSPSPSGSPDQTRSSTAPPTTAPPTIGSPTPGAGVPAFRVDLPPQGCALLVPGQGYHLRIVGLRNDLRPGDSIPVTFTFQGAGQVTVPVPVGVPDSIPPRSPGEPADHE